jgi:hypothetical protein
MAGQTISNVRVTQDPDVGYYTITFDLSGNANETYLIKAVPYKSDMEITNPQFLEGRVGRTPCKTRNNLQLYWDPILEGVDKDGWQFRLLITLSPMVYVQGGSFQMGSTKGDQDEKPVHQVTVSSFYISKFELTVGEFRQFVNATGYRTSAETDGGDYVWIGSSGKKGMMLIGIIRI